MKRYTVASPNEPGLAVYAALTEAQLRSRLEPEKGVFIAESPKVIRMAMSAGYVPLSLLCERRHLTGDAADIVAAEIRARGRDLQGGAARGGAG